MDIGYGWTDRSRVERRKDHVELRLGRVEGNNLMVKVFERMTMGEGNREEKE